MAEQQSPSQDNSMGFVWIIIGTFAAIILLGYFGHRYIVGFILDVKLLEVAIISLFTDSLYNIQQWIHQADPATVTYSQLFELCTQINKGYISIPTILLLLSLCGVLYKTSVGRLLNKNYDMKRLRELERENWPQITPVTELDLVSMNIDEGEWAMAMSPLQFALKHKLMDAKEVASSIEVLDRDIKYELKVRKSRARKVFIRQMGPLWTGIDDLKPHARALFACFAARANHDVDAPAELLAHISRSARTGQLDFTGADELLEKYRHTKVIEMVQERHAYVLTMMGTMLKIARTDGVLATADFLWLKPVDRPLWYMLNSIGRQTVVPEVSGPFGHWLIEKELSRKLKVPMIEQAVTGLQEALDIIEYVPDEAVKMLK